MEGWFFDGWQSVARTLILGTLAYGSLVLLLRVSGKRTLSKLNMFDFVVTVAFGSTLATVILSNDITYTQGLVALGLLVLLQFLLSYLEVRSDRFKRAITAKPSLLYCKPDFCEEMMLAERVDKEEIYAALRQRGYGDIDEVYAVVLETNGTLSILTDSSISKSRLAAQGVAISR